MDSGTLKRLRQQSKLATQLESSNLPPTPLPTTLPTTSEKKVNIWPCRLQEGTWFWSITQNGRVVDNYSGSSGSKAAAEAAAQEGLQDIREDEARRLPEIKIRTVDTLPPQPLPPPGPTPKWAYGVTTVPERLPTYLPRTLKSLEVAGFDKPRLFVDGTRDGSMWEQGFSLDATVRNSRIGAYGNWVLALWELYLREPRADRYAIFQDDFVTYRNLRTYLDSCEYPTKGYWNLITSASNEDRHLMPKVDGWFKSNQFGRGAVGLVFDHATVTELLSSRHMVERVMDPTRGDRKIDGGVIEALKKVEWTEWVHNPSLVEHIGAKSAIGNPTMPKPHTFRGEEYDACILLRKG